MERFEITFRDGTEQVVDADAYQPEGAMTTFFALGDGRQVIDCWARRVASMRTADLMLIRRVDDHGLRAVS